ncbi:MAG: TadE/TadG family type IV pilus assembly protein [Desulfatiglandales bacterium]
MTTSNKNTIRQKEGQALVEFALVVPILIVIILAITEFGRLWMTMNVLTGAAREGVRVAAVNELGTTFANNAAQNVMTAAGMTGTTVTVSGPNAANEMTVTVQMDYTVLTGTIVPGLSGTFQLTRSATMRWEL